MFGTVKLGIKVWILESSQERRPRVHGTSDPSFQVSGVGAFSQVRASAVVNSTRSTPNPNKAITQLYLLESLPLVKDC